MERQNKLVGYARVSTQAQELDLQLDALQKAGCNKKDIFIEKMSGARADRPALKACIDSLEEGDTLVIWSIDRLGRTLIDLVKIVNEQLKPKNVQLKSLKDGVIDTTSAAGNFVFSSFACLAEFERGRIRERIVAGMEAARARGKKGGRPTLKANDEKLLLAQTLFKDTTLSVKDICKMMKISKGTLYYRLHKKKERDNELKS